MLLARPATFIEALRRHLARRVMPTRLGTAEIQRLDSRIRANSFYSAKTVITDLLDNYKQRIGEIISPRLETRIDPDTGEKRQVPVAPSLGTVRMEARRILQAAGYQPDPNKAGTIEDLGSDARINLVTRTNTQMAQNYGWYEQGQDPDVLQAFPCQELIRAEGRKLQRTWQTRWLAACRAVNDADAIRAFGQHTRMVARKDSRVWAALGRGDGGFDSDALGNPYPPFAFNSGMDVRDIGYGESVRLGLMKPGQTVQPMPLEYPDLAQVDVVNSFRGGQPRDAFGRWVDEANPAASLTVRDNIRRGRRVVDWSIRNQADVERGMHRPEVGTISLRWGNAGDKSNDFAGGSGISHIIAKHGERAARKLPVVLAQGKIQPHPKDQQKLEVLHKGEIAVLAKTGNRRSWVITGFKDRRQVGQ